MINIIKAALKNLKKVRITICPRCNHPIDLDTETEVLYQNCLGEQIKLCEACVSELGVC